MSRPRITVTQSPSVITFTLPQTLARKTKKAKSLEKKIIEVLSHYYLDSYNRQAYYQKCAKAILKLIEEMEGKEEEVG